MADRCFITVFGSQHDFGFIHRPKLAHTYATFTKEGDASEVRQELTISWLPRDGHINPLGGPEPGRNYTMGETITWLVKSGSTDRWSSKKTEIAPRLFQSAVERVAELERGSLQYVMIDKMATRPHQASNCIHAVSDLAVAIAELGMLETGILHGNDASRAVYHYLWRFLINPEKPSAEEQSRFEEMHRKQLAAMLAGSNDVVKGL